MSELVVSSRDALAEALLSSHVSEWDGAYWVCSCGSRLVDWAEANWPLKVSLVSVHDRWMGGHQADALLASGVVRPLPDEETVAQVKAEALEEAAVAAIASMELIQNGCATVAPKSHVAGERLVAWLRARAAEYRSGARA